MLAISISSQQFKLEYLMHSINIVKYIFIITIAYNVNLYKHNYNLNQMECPI